MRQLLIATLAALVLGSLGTVLAQANTADHDIRVRIPDLLMLRITNGTDNASVPSPVVNFNFVDNAAGLNAYVALVEGGAAGSLQPTFTNFGDIVVLSNRSSWVVSVEATDFSFADDVLTGQTASGLALSDITVDPSAPVGLGGITGINDTFVLSATPQTVVAGTRTLGWTGLGIGGDAYSIAVNGDEAPGTYETTVTYTITAP